MSLSINRTDASVSPEERNSAKDFIVYDEALVAATEAAIVLGKPLLLTGEPGIGKSVFARWLAHDLGVGDCLKYVVKSDSAARDLFYQFDTLERFRDNQQDQSGARDTSSVGGNSARDNESRLLKYISYNALGRAFLNSLGQTKAVQMGVLSDQINRFEYDQIVVAPSRSVVLIDEIDKAPRDIPNDILDEIDTRRFRLKELSNIEIAANPAHQPVVVITSNSERDLPKPFLRRCIYYHMHVPDEGYIDNEPRSRTEILRHIADARIGARYSQSADFVGDSIKLYAYIRDNVSLRHQPGVAELLDWLGDMASIGVPPGSRLKDFGAYELSLRSTLCKDPQDQKTAEEHCKDWLTAATG